MNFNKINLMTILVFILTGMLTIVLVKQSFILKRFSENENKISKFQNELSLTYNNSGIDLSQMMILDVNETKYELSTLVNTKYLLLVQNTCSSCIRNEIRLFLENDRIDSKEVAILCNQHIKNDLFLWLINSDYQGELVSTDDQFSHFDLSNTESPILLCLNENHVVAKASTLKNLQYTINQFLE